MNSITKNNIQRTFFLIVVTLVMSILTSTYTQALGIAPSSTDMILDGSLEKSVNFKIINNNEQDMEVLIYAEGPLAEYITFPQQVVTLSASEKEKRLSYKVSIPDLKGFKPIIIAFAIPKLNN